MHHIAIMNPRWKLIDKILSGRKTIESRRYKTKRSPRHQVQSGDTIFFKDAGKMVTAQATVAQVMEFADLDLVTIGQIVQDYGDAIGLQNTDFLTRWPGKKYCILMRLSDPRPITSFQINKTGFGTGAAWIAVEDIQTLIV